MTIDVHGSGAVQVDALHEAGARIAGARLEAPDEPALIKDIDVQPLAALHTRVRVVGSLIEGRAGRLTGQHLLVEHDFIGRKQLSRVAESDRDVSVVAASSLSSVRSISSSWLEIEVLTAGRLEVGLRGADSRSARSRRCDRSNSESPDLSAESLALQGFVLTKLMLKAVLPTVVLLVSRERHDQGRVTAHAALPLAHAPDRQSSPTTHTSLLHG